MSDDCLKCVIDSVQRLGYVLCNFNNCTLDSREFSDVEDWIQSPSHLQNIEGDYEWTGIGVHSEEWIDPEGKTQHELYVTQIFLY